MINFYIDSCVGLRPEIKKVFSCQDISEQSSLYQKSIRSKFWGRTMRWIAGRNLTLALLGVPPAQRRQIERGFPGGVSAFIQSRLDNVFMKTRLIENYHWRIYLFGSYTRECCPEYLKPNNFKKLKDGLVDHVSIYTGSVANFLLQGGEPINKFVLLDHLDWLADRNNPELTVEWQAIVNRSARDARVIWRSGGLETDFVNRVQVQSNGKTTTMGELLHYDKDLAGELHELDRVQTYGSFFIADLRPV